jgi:dTDP-4-amino-4,6-dideoxygalactose transaminase
MDVETPRLAAAYRQALTGAPVVVPPERDPGHVYHLFPVLTPERDAFQAHLADRGVGTLVHYPFALTDQPALAPYATTACPVAQRVAATCARCRCTRICRTRISRTSPTGPVVRSTSLIPAR